MQALAYLGELVGAIGVVASLVYLSIQIKRNESTTRAATTQDLLSKSIDMLLSSNSADSPVLKAAVGEQLSASEKVQLEVLYFARFSHFNDAYHQHLSGKLDKEIWEMYDARTRRNLRQIEEFETWWNKYQANFTQSFRKYIQDIKQDG